MFHPQAHRLDGKIPTGFLILRGNRKVKIPEQENSVGENEVFSADLSLFEAIYSVIHEEGFRPPDLISERPIRVLEVGAEHELEATPALHKEFCEHKFLFTSNEAIDSAFVEFCDMLLKNSDLGLIREKLEKSRWYLFSELLLIC